MAHYSAHTSQCSALYWRTALLMTATAACYHTYHDAKGCLYKQKIVFGLNIWLYEE